MVRNGVMVGIIGDCELFRRGQGRGRARAHRRAG